MRSDARICFISIKAPVAFFPITFYLVLWVLISVHVRLELIKIRFCYLNQYICYEMGRFNITFEHVCSFNVFFMKVSKPCILRSLFQSEAV